MLLLLRFYLPSVLISLTLLVWLLLGLRPRLRGWRRGLFLGGALLFCALGGLGLTVLSYGIWFLNRSQPAPLERMLFQGVEYRRLPRSEPRRLVLHLLRIDTRAPGIGFFVTPGDRSAGMEYRAQTTSAFLRRHGLQAAVNGSFFQPWHSHSPWDYYPRAGDPVDCLGIAVSDGREASPAFANWPAFYVSNDGAVGFRRPESEPWQALAGGNFLVLDGRILPSAENADPPPRLSPRCFLGLDETQRWLTIAVIDGRQPGYSEGMTLREAAELALELGCHHAMNLDGGGSATLVAAGPSGQPRLLNTPIHGHLPGRERPVANHLGLRALPLAPTRPTQP